MAQGGINRLPHVCGERVKKKLARNTQTKLSWVGPQSLRFRKIGLPTYARVQNSR
jgi:hypothetical protein